MTENGMEMTPITESNTNPSNQTGGKPAFFEFRGEGFEYFKIWIVNILLTVLTLGIYSAWATVRNKRYFYSNLYLDDNNFSYLASPIQILKGRAIAVIAFLAYYYALTNYPLFGIACSIVLVFAIPFFYNQSLVFNARMSAYKNIQFGFKASYGEAFMVLYVWPLVGILTLGILIPFSLLKMHQYMVRNSAYGTQKFSYEAGHFDYAKIFLVLVGAGLTIGGISWAITLMISESAVIGIVLFSIFYFAAFIYMMVQMSNLYFRSTALASHQFDANLTMPGMAAVVLINALLIVLTLGLYLPAAKVRMTKYVSENVSLNIAGSLDHFVAAEQENVSALGEQMGQVFDFGT